MTIMKPVAHRSAVRMARTRRSETNNVVALAQLYNSPCLSRVVRAEMLDEARRALAKYDLAEADLEIAAQELARTLHMLVEQRGAPLEPQHKAEMERRVLEWCGSIGPLGNDGDRQPN
jgi:hypothetical protein